RMMSRAGCSVSGQADPRKPAKIIQLALHSSSGLISSRAPCALTELDLRS
ncbi:unnamed protein product, partial [Mycena citricolor]